MTGELLGISDAKRLIIDLREIPPIRKFANWRAFFLQRRIFCEIENGWLAT
jgi:hypothetical protein